MTIKTYGVTGSMDTKHWARIMHAQGVLQSDHGVFEGLAVTKTANAREFSIAAGKALHPGALLESDAALLRTAVANSGSDPRRDLICSKVNWNGTTMDTAGDFVIVPGQEGPNPVPPSLTDVAYGQDAGNIWYEPIAQYKMQGGVVSELTAPAKSEQRSSGSQTYSINGSGLATITHGLGALPNWFQATVLNSNWLTTPVWSSRTTDTIQVAVRALSTGALVTSTSGSFIWKAEA